ncbi:MAG: hypothetical protein R2854_03590 [Caldilineaceae bacterium]
MASDGYNTGAATSPAFTVTNRKPSFAPIFTPVQGQAYPAATVVLRGSATDPEDGGLSDAVGMDCRRDTGRQRP